MKGYGENLADTRNKILTIEEARVRFGGHPNRVAVAYCDPLLPSHLPDLASEDGLILVIASPADAYLPARARAELAASLGSVHAVVIAEDDPHGVAQSLTSQQPMSLHEAEAERRATFIAYVRERAQ